MLVAGPHSPRRRFESYFQSRFYLPRFIHHHPDSRYQLRKMQPAAGKSDDGQNRQRRCSERSRLHRSIRQLLFRLLQLHEVVSDHRQQQRTPQQLPVPRAAERLAHAGEEDAKLAFSAIIQPTYILLKISRFVQSKWHVRKTPSWPRSWANSTEFFVAVFPHECMGQLAYFGST